MTIYEIDNWIELFDKYEQLNSIKLCSTCWGDKVKVFNYFKTMAKKKTELTENKYKFKPQFADSKVLISGVGFEINADNLTDEIVEKYFINELSLFALIELV
jgi:hypothetical protein